MSRNRFRRSLIFGATVCVVALVGRAPIEAATVEQTVDETLPFERGSRLVLTNTNGSVEVSSWQQEALSIRAVKRVRAATSSRGREQLERVEIDIRPEAGGVRVETRLPRTSSSLFSWLFGGGGSVSVSYAIRLPATADVEITTVNGSVTLVSVEGRHRVSSTNGRITLREAAGSIVASTTNGGIDAELADVAGDRPVSLHTTNGAIRVALPRDIAAALSARTTNGSITTDFPIQVLGRWSRHSLSGEINGGGPQIELRTTNGSIRVAEL